MSAANTEGAPDVKPAEASGPRRPVFQMETTGSYWGDRWEALKRISPVKDTERIGEIPCARNSLLSGIASGLGIGVMRALSTGPMVASNWAVGTFLVVTVGTWELCQANMRRERERMQQVVETLPKRFAQRADTVTKPTTDSPPSTVE